MIADPDASEQALPYKPVCGILTDSENVLNLIHMVNSFFLHKLPP